MAIQHLLYVAIGGILGSVSRYIISFFIQRHSGSLQFPVGTLVVNVIGCLLLGYLIAKISSMSKEYSLLLATGFCGSLTTFSTFSFENTQLLQNGNLFLVFTYISGSIILGLGAIFFGLYLGR